MSQRALFEVRVPGVSLKEEVRVSGSIRALGEWAVHRSVPMSRRDSPPDTWYLELEVPVDLTVQYRYLVVQRFKSAESKDAFGVVRWETTLHPRHFCLAGTAGKGDMPDGPLKVPDGPHTVPDGPLKVPGGPRTVPDGPLKVPDGPPTVPDGPLTAPEVMTPFTRQDGTFGENEGVSTVTVSWQPAHLLYTPTTADYDSCSLVLVYTRGISCVCTHVVH